MLSRVKISLLSRWQNIRIDIDTADSGRCPAGFVQVDDKSCYRAVSKSLDWWQAVDECSRLDPDAFPVAINNEQEQHAVDAVCSLLGQLYRFMTLCKSLFAFPPHLSHILSLMLAWCKESTEFQVLSCLTEVLCTAASIVARSIVLYVLVQASLLCGALSRWAWPTVIGFFFIRGLLVTR